MFNDRSAAKKRDAVVTQSNGWYIGLLLFKVALESWQENPKAPYLPTLMAKLCLSFAMSLQKQQCI